MAREVDVACAVHGDAVAVVCSGATDISKQGHPGCDIRGRSQKCNADNQGESHSTQSIRYGAKRRSPTEQNASVAESVRPERRYSRARSMPPNRRFLTTTRAWIRFCSAPRGLEEI